MNDIVKELMDTGDKFLLERPADMDTFRKRMGTRGQNASIAIYAYIDLNSSVDILYQLQKDCLDEDYDFKTIIKIAVDWLNFLAPERITTCFRLDNTARITVKAVDELKKAASREEARSILQGLEHYYNQIRSWVDLEFPWHEVGEVYAKVKGDPPVSEL